MKRKHFLLALMATGTATPCFADYTLITLVTFNGINGYMPQAGLISDAAGNLYGTTEQGGDLTTNLRYGSGTVFQVAAGTYALNTLVSFDHGHNGNYLPNGGLLIDAAGNLYGTTMFGSDIGDGSVFELPREPAWIAAGSETWSTGSNWDLGTAPNAQAIGVVFANGIGNSAATVTITSPVTVGIINFNNTLGGSYTIAGSSTLTIDDTADFAGANPAINVLAGSDTMNAPIYLVNGMTLYVAPSTALTLGGAISGMATITATGGGTVNVGSGVLPSSTALTISNATTVALASSVGSQSLASLSIDATSTLNVGKQMVSIPDAAGLNSATYNTILALIKSGYVHHGTGIVLPAGSVGNAAVGIIDTGGTLKFGYTIIGDATMDGSVGFSDLVKVAQNYNSTTGTWQTGDFNYDGSTNFTDLVKVAQSYTQQVSGAQVAELDAMNPSFASDWAAAQAVAAAVPEPASLGLLAVGAIGLLGRRRHHA